MSELERLNEALAEVDRYQVGFKHYALFREAARAYRDLLANGQRVEWCEEHDAESVQNHRGMSDECWRVVWVDNGQGNPEEVPYPYDLCRIVSKLLSVYPKEAENR